MQGGGDGNTPQHAALHALRKRNARVAAACRLTRSYEGLLSRNAVLQVDLQKQHQRADSLVKEKLEMQADLALLRQNEANAGVSREHIEVLQQQLEIAKSEAARASKDAADANAQAQAAKEAAMQLGDKVSQLGEQLANALAERDGCREALDAQARQTGEMQRENGQLLQRLMDQMHMQAQAMNSEIAQHEERLASRPAVVDMSTAIPVAPGPACAAEFTCATEPAPGVRALMPALSVLPSNTAPPNGQLNSGGTAAGED